MPIGLDDAPQQTRNMCARCAQNLDSITTLDAQGLVQCKAGLEIREAKRCARCDGLHKEYVPVSTGLALRSRETVADLSQDPCLDVGTL